MVDPRDLPEQRRWNGGGAATKAPIPLRTVEEVRHLRDSLEAVRPADVAGCPREWEAIKRAVDEKLNAAYKERDHAEHR